MSAIERLLEALNPESDAALIFRCDQFYFTGFPSSAGTLLMPVSRLFYRRFPLY